MLTLCIAWFATAALCSIEEFSKAFAFARSPRTEHDCKLPEQTERGKGSSSSLMATIADEPDRFHASDYIGSYLLFGLVAVAGVLAWRRHSQYRQLRDRDENLSLLS